MDRSLSKDHPTQGIAMSDLSSSSCKHLNIDILFIYVHK
jgi:hypothetical protein